MSDTEPEPIETTDAEDAEILLADPEDYHQAQRLREIHEARRNVHTVLNSIERYTGSSEHRRQKFDLADAVTLYASELLPLMKQADFDTTLPDSLPWDNIEQYTLVLGRAEDIGYNHHHMVFQQCNVALAKIKPLVQEDDTDEWEV